MSKNKYHSGFTLIELMATVAVVIIVATIAIPSFSTFVQNNRLVASNNELVLALNTARSEAVKRSRSVVVCPGSATTGCTASTRLEDGWLIWSDLNSNDTFDAGEEIVEQGALQSNSIRASGFGGINQIEFERSGLPKFTGTVTVCDSRGAEHARAVVVEPTGRVAVAIDRDSDGIVNDHDGANVSCP